MVEPEKQCGALSACVAGLRDRHALVRYLTAAVHAACAAKQEVGIRLTPRSAFRQRRKSDEERQAEREADKEEMRVVRAKHRCVWPLPGGRMAASCTIQQAGALAIIASRSSYLVLGDPATVVVPPTLRSNRDVADEALDENLRVVIVDGYNAIFGDEELKRFVQYELGSPRAELNDLAVAYAEATGQQYVAIVAPDLVIPAARINLQSHRNKPTHTSAWHPMCGSSVGPWRASRILAHWRRQCRQCGGMGVGGHAHHPAAGSPLRAPVHPLPPPSPANRACSVYVVYDAMYGNSWEDTVERLEGGGGQGGGQAYAVFTVRAEADTYISRLTDEMKERGAAEVRGQ